ncbi:hypothetical protein ZWY2020_058987 [Hordeum vulgare]|nr:hypothetical protein ZWY2020_058987 [Hordeum vulgare]
MDAVAPADWDLGKMAQGGAVVTNQSFEVEEKPWQLTEVCTQRAKKHWALHEGRNKTILLLRWARLGFVLDGCCGTFSEMHLEKMAQGGAVRTSDAAGDLSDHDGDGEEHRHALKDLTDGGHQV